MGLIVLFLIVFLELMDLIFILLGLMDYMDLIGLMGIMGLMDLIVPIMLDLMALIVHTIMDLMVLKVPIILTFMILIKIYTFKMIIHISTNNQRKMNLILKMKEIMQKESMDIIIMKMNNIIQKTKIITRKILLFNNHKILGSNNNMKFLMIYMNIL
jgi:hypothetical protein